jgi:hypothetical protein
LASEPGTAGVCVVDQANDGLEHAIISAASAPRQAADLLVALAGGQD